MWKLITINSINQVRSLQKCSGSLITQNLRRAMCSIEGKEPTKLSGFAQAFEKHSQPAEVMVEEDVQTFESLFQNSKLVDVSIVSLSCCLFLFDIN